MAARTLDQPGMPPVILAGGSVFVNAMKGKQPSGPNAGHQPSARAPAVDEQDPLDSLQRCLEEGQREVFRHVRAQISQLALDNLQLRQQLSEKFPATFAQPQATFAQPQADGFGRPWADAVSPFRSLQSPSSPEGAVLGQVENIPLPDSPLSPPPGSAPRPPKEASLTWTAVLPGELTTVLPGELPEIVSTLDQKPAPASRDVSIKFSEERRKSTSAETNTRKSIAARQSSIMQKNSRKTRMTMVKSQTRMNCSSGADADASVVKFNQSWLFPDKTELMAEVQKALIKPEYKVANLYRKEGLAQRVARNNVFETATLAVIGLNSIWIAIDTDHNPDPLQPPLGFVVVENFFCGFFFIELLIRFLAFEKKLHCLKDRWFVFDGALVMVAVLETWVMALVRLVSGMSLARLMGKSSAMLRLLRMARLARTARMARLLRAVPELMIMFKGMVVASHAVVCTIFLLAIIIYVFALTFRQLTAGSTLGETHFSSVSWSMHTLLLRGTLPDVGDFLSDLSDSHTFLGVVGLTFVLLAMLVVLNMLAGVLVNVVIVVADLEKEQADATFVKNSLPVFLGVNDLDGDQFISKTEFDNLLVKPQTAKILRQVNVDIMGLVELSDFIFMDGDEQMPYEDFLQLVLKLRGTNTATVKDIVEMRKFIVQEIGMLEQYMFPMIEDVFAKVCGPPQPEPPSSVPRLTTT